MPRDRQRRVDPHDQFDLWFNSIGLISHARRSEFRASPMVVAKMRQASTFQIFITELSVGNVEAVAKAWCVALGVPSTLGSLICGLITR